MAGCYTIVLITVRHPATVNILFSYIYFFFKMSALTNLTYSKPHYQILDGLRGIAALIVVMFHIFEAHAGGDHIKQILNHGYLAVDFFFMLSGYVIAYSYDDRWSKLSLKDFLVRRIVRLQPMIIVGSIVGGLTFYLQDSEALGWGGISEVPIGKTLLIMFIGFTLIPVGKSMDIRGWSEMHPLNGPAWTLFFEYIANIAYALILRHLPNIILSVLVVMAAGMTVHHTLTTPNGDMIGGWTIDDPQQLKIGFIRLAFPFLAGLLLARVAKLKRFSNAFPITSILLALLLVMPRFGVKELVWQNGLYESFCILILFPLIIWIGAGGKVEGAKASKLCTFLGDISYPIYITHYPLIYIYTAWVANGSRSLEQSLPVALLTFLGAIALALGTMRFIDIPVRDWLGKRFIGRKSNEKKEELELMP